VLIWSFRKDAAAAGAACPAKALLQNACSVQGCGPGPRQQRNGAGEEELFPAEQARIIHLWVYRADIGPGGADVRLKLDGLASLAWDLATPPAESARVAT
jgi:hypothetical protein